MKVSRFWVFSTLLAMLAILSSAPASSAPLIPELRPRAGLGTNPDQFVVGLQALLRARLGGLARLAPSLDLGFGDNLTSTLVNVDLLSKTLPLGENLGLYGGGGVGFAWYSSDGDTNSEIGLNLVAGAEIKERFYVETRFGFDTMPDFRILAGLRMLQK